MLPILCGIGCAVLVILDVAGKLHPERTRSQVLLHLFSLVGALLPLAAMVWVYVLSQIRPIRILCCKSCGICMICRHRCPSCPNWQ